MAGCGVAGGRGRAMPPGCQKQVPSDTGFGGAAASPNWGARNHTSEVCVSRLTSAMSCVKKLAQFDRELDVPPR